MTEKTLNKIKELTLEINGLKSQIDEHERNLKELYLEDAKNLVGLYIEYDTGCYMKVEKQFVNRALLVLEGPVIMVDTEALNDDGDEIMEAKFCSSDRVYVTAETLGGVGPTTIHIMSRSEMEQVLTAVSDTFLNFFGL